MADSQKTLEERAAKLGMDLSLLEPRLSMSPEERIRAHEAARRLAVGLARAMEVRRVQRREPAEEAD